ncbi:hypothetical protein UCRPA7_6461 [Phaeoacremonium minimum UCRPA7]|uniref:Uncharacterized protein n=1 Tax=Phaeoacremonium minimum (strain UCR-PA7) TaxID=1286976 RepID=R8BFC5_PHAM7|nr:hypothetical protein UCRPA7_6461 [Phaeoacremonium minimum UCRPA7]EON97994.1 hypothetical protein UCRPA7_6461 [Phaeoacremonium minimum UCRPA7]
MSSSIAIPAGPSVLAYEDRRSSKAPASSSSSTYSSSPRTPSSSLNSTPNSAQKQKMTHERRPSLLSTAISKQECTLINIADPDGPPRLIGYLSSSQGFVWNPEIFLPSYIDCDYVPLENRREPVHDIVLSDEEVKNMLPQ